MIETIILVGMIITGILIGTYTPPPPEYPSESWDIDRDDLQRRRRALEQDHDEPDCSDTPTDHRHSADPR